MKALLWICLLVGIGLYVVVFHSAVRQELVCKGHWKSNPSDPETAFVQIEEYRPWVGLWSSSGGNVKVATDKFALQQYIPALRRNMDGLLTLYSFYEYDHSKGMLGTMVGGYRVANGEITFKFSPDLTFIGNCQGS